MGNKLTIYELMEMGRVEDALVAANNSYRESKTDLNLSRRLHVYLYMKDYKNALSDSLELIETRKYIIDSDYIHAGICYWFINNIEEALVIWKKGLNAKYTDAAGGIAIPSLLYSVSVILKDENLRKEAIALLKDKWKSPTVINFPSSVSGYLLGEINEEKFFSTVSDVPLLRERHLCTANFYKAVKLLEQSNKMGYITYLAETISDFSFLEPEYYFAIGELEKNKGYNPINDENLNWNLE